MEEFLDHITIGWPPLAGEGGNGWPPSLVATIRMRYTLLAHGHALGQKGRAEAAM